MTRRPAPDSRPVALSIAGSDSGGGAGVQADVAAMAAHGAFPTTAVTAVTAQNSTGVADVHPLPAPFVLAQADAVLEDFAVGAVKTGMLATAPVVEAVTDRLHSMEVPTVVDPVMIAASGDRLLDRDAERAYEALVGEATLVTPNTDEAAVLADRPVEDAADQIAAGRELRGLGADAALVKGGHAGGETVEDVLVADDGVHRFEHPRIDTDATHGSGCVLSSTITALLARGADLEAAVAEGTAFMERAVRYHYDVGSGPGAVNPQATVRERAARQPTAESVHHVVDRLVDAGVRRLVPEVGMNVVGATPFAETPAETAAVEGRITKTMAGIAPNRGVRFGASSHVARFLLACRESDPSLRFAVNLRYDDAVEDALGALEGPVAAFDRAEEPMGQKETEGSTMGWGARRAMDAVEGTPIAVTDAGAVGKEPIVKLLARDAETVLDRALTLADAVASR